MNVDQAETIARMVHREHLYGTRPYIEAHVLPVVQRVIDEGGGEDAIVVAWLHDVLEDSREISFESRPMLLLTQAQARALAAITCREGEKYSAYIARAVQDPIARLVKYCDLLVNLSNQPPERLRTRYLAALEVVRANLDASSQLPRRSMMRAVAAAAADIDAELKTRDGLWSQANDLECAALAIAWCSTHDWPLSSQVTPERLQAAMQRMPFWNQGPSHHFDMARALSAAFLVGAEVAP